MPDPPLNVHLPAFSGDPQHNEWPESLTFCTLTRSPDLVELLKSFFSEREVYEMKIAYDSYVFPKNSQTTILHA